LLCPQRGYGLFYGLCSPHITIPPMLVLRPQAVAYIRRPYMVALRTWRLFCLFTSIDSVFSARSQLCTDALRPFGRAVPVSLRRKKTRPFRRVFILYQTQCLVISWDSKYLVWIDKVRVFDLVLVSSVDGRPFLASAVNFWIL